MMVYAYEVQLNCGAWVVVALYTTKREAWFAMRRELVRQYTQAREDWLMFGRQIWERGAPPIMYQSYDGQRVKTYRVNGNEAGA